MAARVVITAMGAVTSLGNSPQEMLRSVLNDRVTFQTSRVFSDVAVAPVQDFVLRKHTGRHKNLRYLNRGAALSVAAALDAVRGAGLTPSQLETAGLFAGAGPNLDLSGECRHIDAGQMIAEGLSALWILRFLPNTAASTIAQLAGLRGENLSVGNACAASLQAVGEAFRKIKHGDLEVALAGGGDSRLSEGALLAYQKAGALYAGDAPPLEAIRPFDTLRKGFVPGEGGAFFLLESAENAARRGAEVLAEICGYGASIDGFAMTAPNPDGRWAEIAVRRALKDAGMTAEGIEMVSAHGTGTELNDAVEADMIQRIFRERRPHVLALKSWIGHLASACGAVELAMGLAAMQAGLWPRIRNLKRPCCGDVNFLRANIDAHPNAILFQNFGFGGQNAVLVIRPWTS